MEVGKDGRFPFHAILNNLEQVKSCGLSIHTEKFIFDLVVKDCLISKKIAAASWISPRSTQLACFIALQSHTLIADRHVAQRLLNGVFR